MMIDEALLEVVDQAAEYRGTTRSEVIRDTLIRSFTAPLALKQVNILRESNNVVYDKGSQPVDEGKPADYTGSKREKRPDRP